MLDEKVYLCWRCRVVESTVEFHKQRQHPKLSVIQTQKNTNRQLLILAVPESESPSIQFGRVIPGLPLTTHVCHKPRAINLSFRFLASSTQGDQQFWSLLKPWPVNVKTYQKPKLKDLPEDRLKHPTQAKEPLLAPAWLKHAKTKIDCLHKCGFPNPKKLPISLHLPTYCVESRDVSHLRHMLQLSLHFQRKLRRASDGHGVTGAMVTIGGPSCSPTSTTQIFAISQYTPTP